MKGENSFFVGKYSVHALTALTAIYPLQLIIVALAVGTGVGVNTYMARKYAQGEEEEAENTEEWGCRRPPGQEKMAAV